MLSVSLTPVLQESLLRLSKCLRVAGEEAGEGPIHPSLEGLKCEDTCLAVFPSILTVFQRLLPNPGYQGRSGKLQGGVVTPGGSFPSHTLWLPAVSRSGNQGSRSGWQMCQPWGDQGGRTEGPPPTRNDSTCPATGYIPCSHPCFTVRC